MSTTYKTKSGDTYESIARKKYGNENEAYRIQSANPGYLTEPFISGLDIIVPDIQDAPTNKQKTVPSTDTDDLSVIIENERFAYWTDFKITKSIDSLSTVEFSAPFEVEREFLKNIFKPFSFKKTICTINGDPIFNGVLVNSIPDINENQKTINATCYSKPGVLNDCTAPASLFPLEFDNQGLKEISEKFCMPFGISVDFQANQGAIFDRVSCNPGRKIFGFLSELAKQRSVVISDTNDGKLLFWQSLETGTPIAKLTQGESPLISVTPNFNPQNYYSDITGLEPITTGFDGSQYTVKNSRLKNTIRPYVYKVNDTLNADVKTAVEAKAGRMFADLASYDIQVSTWRTPSGELWDRNKIITLNAPDAMVYNDYKFLIRKVIFEKNGNKKTARLNLILPGTYSGKLPESLPWD